MSAYFIPSVPLEPARLGRAWSRRLAVTFVLWLLLGGRALWAIDPLPKEVEQAPLSVQAAFIERREEESGRLRRVAAEQRSEERGRMRETLAVALRREASTRHQEMQEGSGAGPSAEASGAVLAQGAARPSRRFLLALGCLGVLVFLHQFRVPLLGVCRTLFSGKAPAAVAGQPPDRRGRQL